MQLKVSRLSCHGGKDEVAINGRESLLPEYHVVSGTNARSVSNCCAGSSKEKLDIEVIG